MTLLSVMGLYHSDESIFDTFTLPGGIDRQTLISNLLTECAELEILLPDPEIFKISLGYWSNSRVQVWEHLDETQHYVYNPIWNKDGSYKEKETRDLSSTADTTATGKVTGYNSSAFQNRDQQIMGGSGTDKGTITRERQEQGNIGVTTTQQMIKEEREIADFDLYRIIINEFKYNYCVGVY